MKIVYITAQAPYSKGETFIIAEMLAIKYKVDLYIIPRNPEKELFHNKAEILRDNTIWLSLLNLKMFINFLFLLITNPQVWRVIINIFRYSRNLPILIKNLIVLPKGIYIKNYRENENRSHSCSLGFYYFYYGLLCCFKSSKFKRG